MLTDYGKDYLLRKLLNKDLTYNNRNNILDATNYYGSSDLKFYKQIKQDFASFPNLKISLDLLPYGDFFIGYAVDGSIQFPRAGFFFIVNKEMELVEINGEKYIKKIVDTLGQERNIAGIFDVKIVGATLIFYEVKKDDYDLSAFNNKIIIASIPVNENLTTIDFFTKSEIDLKQTKINRDNVRIYKAKYDEENFYIVWFVETLFLDIFKNNSIKIYTYNIKKGEFKYDSYEENVKTITLQDAYIYQTPAALIATPDNLNIYLELENSGLRINMAGFENKQYLASDTVEHTMREFADLIYYRFYLTKDKQNGNIVFVSKEARIEDVSNFSQNVDRAFGVANWDWNSMRIVSAIMKYNDVDVNEEKNKVKMLVTDGDNLSNSLRNAFFNNNRQSYEIQEPKVNELKTAIRRMLDTKKNNGTYVAKNWIADATWRGGAFTSFFLITSKIDKEWRYGGLTWKTLFLNDLGLTPIADDNTVGGNGRWSCSLNVTETSTNTTWRLKGTRAQFKAVMQMKFINKGAFYFSKNLETNEETFFSPQGVEIDTMQHCYVLENYALFISDGSLTQYVRQGNEWIKQSVNMPNSKNVIIKELPNGAVVYYMNRSDYAWTGALADYRNNNIQNIFQSTDPQIADIKSQPLIFNEQNLIYICVLDPVNLKYIKYSSNYDGTTPDSKPYFFLRYDNDLENLKPARIVGVGNNKPVADIDIINSAISDNNILLIGELNIDSMNNVANDKWLIVSNSNTDIVSVNTNIDKTAVEKKQVSFNIKTTFKDLNKNFINSQQSNNIAQFFNENVTQDVIDKSIPDEFVIEFENNIGNTIINIKNDWVINYNKLEGDFVKILEFRNKQNKKFTIKLRNSKTGLIINEFIAPENIDIDGKVIFHTKIFFKQ